MYKYTLLFCLFCFIYLTTIAWMTHIIGGGVPVAGETCDYTDSFTGSDGSDPSGWTEEIGFWDIQSNTYRGGATNSMTRYDTSLGGANQYALHECTDIGTSTGKIGFILRSTSDGTGNRYIVIFNVAGDVIWQRYDATTWQETIETDSAVLSISDGDYFAVEVNGTGNDTTLDYWHWTSDPGGRDSWGTADGQMTNNPGTAVDTGNYTGLYNANEFQKRDNFCAGIQ